MTDNVPMEVFLATAPGLEGSLAEEAEELGFASGSAEAGGVRLDMPWPEVWRANLMLRTASRVLVRIGSFRAPHLAQLDKRARRFDWGAVLRRDIPVRVEATCKRSRIYHAGAAAQRIGRAISEELGAQVLKGTEGEDSQSAIRLLARIEDDLCTFSVDSSGAPLHRRGLKQAVGKAPLRETLAAAFLRQCGFTGTEPVVDPMCGSGTFVLEAAEIALGLAPGRARAFAFERLANFDAAAWEGMRKRVAPDLHRLPRFYGSDRDAGAIRFATENAHRAEIGAATSFLCRDVKDAVPPPGPTGLVMVNPPYGGRIGNKRLLYSVYAALGDVLRARFAGWRVGLVTSEAGLARASGLPFHPPGPPIPHGGLKIRLWHTGPLPSP